WSAIVIIALLIFIVLMMRGIQFGWGDKSVAIGKKFDNKLETFKKDLEIENIKRGQDEVLQKTLFKKCITFDDFLEASLLKSVKKLEADVYILFKPFLLCQYPALCVADIFEDALIERVHFNNMKKKLMKENRTFYIDTIINDIKNNYSIFYEQLKNLHCGEEYPEWKIIEEEVKVLVRKWLLQCLDYYIANVKKKIALYKKQSKHFKLEDMRTLATTVPIRKNKQYLLNLEKAKEEMRMEKMTNGL
ncbi:MAG: hypothetical protein ACTTKH_04075, partial [Treponema sp.]